MSTKPAAAAPSSSAGGNTASSTSASSGKTIEVFLRVRPLVGREIEEKDTTNNLKLDPTDRTKVTISQPSRAGVAPRTFNFHHVFPPEATQKEVYDRFAQKAVTSALDGYHGVLFVFGQTGSGKSHTISNDEPGQEGMLQRCVRDIFERIATDTSNEYTCSVSYVQLYNEILTDLLEDGTTTNNHVKLVGVSDVNSDLSLVSERTGERIGKRVRDEREALDLYNLGSTRKEISKTKMNETSSRSHCIYTMEISRRPRVGASSSSSSSTTSAPPRALEGKLILCDLAGSERIMKTGAKGQQLVEAASINGSLLVLGKVVSALTDKSVQHVPFRESKLTRMLQYSLSGYGKTSIVVNVSPSDYNTEETLSAIQFGQRAIQIKEAAQQHVILDYKALYLQLQSQLDKQLETAVESALRDERREHELEVRDLKARIKELEQERDLLSGKGGGGGSSSNSAANGSSSNGGSNNNSNNADFVSQVAALRESHESNLRTVTAERDSFRSEVSELKQRLSQVESNLFAVAKKFEAFRITAATKQQAWLARMNEMAAEVAAVKKCDFLAIDNLDEALALPGISSNSTGGASGSATTSGAGTPSTTNLSLHGTGVGGGGGASEEELDRAYLVIQALQQERQNMIIYQHKARQAIRMLYRDLQEALQQAKTTK